MELSKFDLYRLKKNKRLMKATLTLAFIAITLSLFAQVPGKKSYAPVHYDNDIVLHVGDTLHLATGTNPNGNFKHIYSPGALMNAYYGVGDADGKLSSTYNNSWLIVDVFRIHKPRKSAPKTYIQIKVSGFDANYTVDLNEAIRDGEIIAINSMDVSIFKEQEEADPTTTNPTTPSIADEILKLKALLDEGVITEDEFQKAKEALLNGGK